MIRSAARPWCVGRMCSKPVRSRTTRSMRLHESEPAYASSPIITPAHWRALIADVPLSVSRSIITWSESRRNGL